MGLEGWPNGVSTRFEAERPSIKLSSTMPLRPTSLTVEMHLGGQASTSGWRSPLSVGCKSASVTVPLTNDFAVVK